MRDEVVAGGLVIAFATLVTAHVMLVAAVAAPRRWHALAALAAAPPTARCGGWRAAVREPRAVHRLRLVAGGDVALDAGDDVGRLADDPGDRQLRDVLHVKLHAVEQLPQPVPARSDADERGRAPNEPLASVTSSGCRRGRAHLRTMARPREVIGDACGTDYQLTPWRRSLRRGSAPSPSWRGAACAARPRRRRALRARRPRGPARRPSRRRR
jgi:hypothetical protein